MRKAEYKRKTKETDIVCSLNIDGAGNADVTTGVGFLDHMLETFAKHSGFDISVEAAGDLHVDCHHTVEDVGICLGKTFAEAASDKSGIARYGSFHAPMDEALAFCAVDISGRPFIVFDGAFTDGKIGEYDTQATLEFFRAFAFNALITLHINILYGENDHHKTEAVFKAFAHAMAVAAAKTGTGILSAKGAL